MSHLLVLEALTRACSQNVDELKVAQIHLEEWETKPGFYSTLLAVINDHSLGTDARWMASVVLKKGVDRYWRKIAPKYVIHLLLGWWSEKRDSLPSVCYIVCIPLVLSAISEAEKKELRAGLLNTYREPVNQVAVQIATIIAKAARIDCPNEWQELMPSLIDVVVKEDNLEVRNRVLLILRHVIKTLSHKPLANDRRFFHELTKQLYSFMLNFHNSAFEAFFSQVQNADPQCQATLGNVLLSLKIMHYLTMHGFNRPNDSPEVVQFVSSVFDRTKTMLHIRKTVEGSCQMIEILEKVVIKLIKVLLAMLESYPLSFVPFIHPSLSLTVALVFTPEGDGLLFQRFIIKCFRLIQQIILCLEYKIEKAPTSGVISVAPEVVEAHRIKTEFFRDELCVDMCMKLVTHYMKLQQTDLELWDCDPEEFIIFNDSRPTVRTCAETLFVALFRPYRDVLSPVIVQLVRANYHPVAPHDLDAVLTKDAVYLSVGLAAFDLYDEIDMDSWFETLQQELNIREGHYRIIRRRASWMLGQWSGVRFSQRLRPALYGTFMHLLQKNEDIVVRWTTANALKHAIDDFVFDPVEFMEFVESCMFLLFELLKDCKEDDNMIHIINVLSFVIERVGAAIQPYSNALFQHIPIMWNNSEDRNLLRSAVLNVVFAFAKVLVMDDLFPFFYTILDDCFDLEKESHAYLLEDGLEVWSMVMENTSTMNSPLFHLLKKIKPILDRYSDNIRVCCEIVQSYIVLAPKEVLSEFGDEIFSSMYDLINDLRIEAVIDILEVVELALTVDPEATINKAMPLICHAFLTVHSGTSSIMMASAVLTISSRVVLHSLEKFGQIVENVSQVKGVAAEAFLDEMLLTWTDRMGVVTNEQKRKLLSLALTSLLTVNSPAVMNRITGILDIIIEAFFDVVEVTDDSLVDTLLMARDTGETGYETVNELRKQEIRKKDFVYNIHLGQFLKSQMEAFCARLEPQDVERIMGSLKSNTVEGLCLTKSRTISAGFESSAKN